MISDWLKFCRHSVSSCLAPKKFLPLSLWYEISVPYLDSKWIRQDRNASVVIENANRMSTARGDRHVSMHPYPFTLLRNTFTSIGPKSLHQFRQRPEGQDKAKSEGGRPSLMSEVWTSAFLGSNSDLKYAYGLSDLLKSRLFLTMEQIILPDHGYKPLKRVRSHPH